MSKEYRTYTLPDGKETNSEKRFKEQWGLFANRVAKPLGLKAAKIGQMSCNFQLFFKKSNGKKAMEKDFNMPYWLVNRILKALYSREKEIVKLNKHIGECHKFIRVAKRRLEKQNEN